jgi:ATP-dependent Clp protease ATP-binding subunit ClpA
VLQYFVDGGYEPTMGARPLKRMFENELKKPLSKKILFDDLKNIKINLELVNGEISFANTESI